MRCLPRVQFDSTPSLSALASGGFVGDVNRLRQLGATLENWKLLRPRTGRSPTLRAWVLVGAVGTLVMIAAFRTVFPFLAITARVPTDLLVVEGWIPDFAVRAGLEEYRAGGYRELICTGGPVEKGGPLFVYKNFAEVGRATLEKWGAPTGHLHAVPAAKVKRDRTYVSAVALRDWFRQRGPAPAALNVVTTDVHARRTRLLFEKAFGAGTRIGIIAVPDDRFDGVRWWRTSEGVRTVFSESLGYFYARVFFVISDDQNEP